MSPIRHDKKKGLNRPSLDDILSGPDEFGLLNVKAKYSSNSTSLDVTMFEEINVFIDQHGRQPSSDGDLSEKLLARRLQSYLRDTNSHTKIKEIDRHNLLDCSLTTDEPLLIQPASEKNDIALDSIASSSKTSIPDDDVTSLDDIFSSDAFSELDDSDNSIFNIDHVPPVSRDTPDEIAQRRVCHDFNDFEHIFRDVHEKLKSGKLSTCRFQQASQMREGDLFILEGVLCLIDEVGEFREDSQGRYDPRLRVIFENGTESNHLLQSLAKRLYIDETGLRILREADSIVDSFNNISHKDKRSGQIYFVTTKSENPDIKAIPNLIKIGYTEQTVEERTKNAEKDTAFLEAPVKILASMECFNMNPNKFETLIHGFLHAQRLKITLIGKNGKAYHPKEWFSVPLDTAREVVKRIIDGSIVKYRMDNTTGKLVRKNES